MRTVLTIAGSDSSGGAGIQADLKTFTVLHVYGLSVVTSVTAQNTAGVYAVENCTPSVVQAQLEAVFSDVFPDAVKIGMVSNTETIKVIANFFAQHSPRQIVLDPVMISTSGFRLLDQDALETLKSRLFPLVQLITPNIPEAEALSGISIRTRTDMEKAAKIIARKYSGSLLIKGGHSSKGSWDLLLHEGQNQWLSQDRIPIDKVHGTGCTLSSAIACWLAKGESIPEAVKKAKQYVTGALRHIFLHPEDQVGKESRLLYHAYVWKPAADAYRKSKTASESLQKGKT